MRVPPTSLEALVASFRPASAVEAADVALVEELARSGDPWSRDRPVHVTCSALIVHPSSRRVLLRWHERQQSWLHVGGHADPGETDPFAVARREAVEETGLTDVVPWPGPAPTLLHVVVVGVPPGGGEPAHRHADLRCMLATDRPDDIVAEHDRAPLRWLAPDEARALTAEDNLRESLDRIDHLLRRAPGAPAPGSAPA